MAMINGAPPAPPAPAVSGGDFALPHDFGSYELLSQIGRGGMGIVFRARQKRPDRTVALKVIATGELASPAAVERFRTEAQAAARLEHPNIVPIFEVGQHGTWHFFSMRLIEGPTLAQTLAGRPMPPGEAARLMAKIARAVHHAHQRGILHRDLKPSNILLDAQGEPHLMDFGLAKLIENEATLTQSNMVMGTPAYMSPEQATGQARDVTTAVDVYGLGAVLYEMLTGHPPFQDANIHLLLRKIAEDDPLPPSRSLLPGARSGSTVTQALHADLDAICLKALEKESSLRYPTAERLADDLERALRAETILAKPSTRWQRLRKWVLRNPAKAGLVATAASALVLLTAVSLAFNVRLSRARNNALSSLVSQHLRESASLNAAGDAFMGMLPLIEVLKLEGKDSANQKMARERLSTTLQLSPRLVRLWNAGGTPGQLQFSSDGRRLLAVTRSGEPPVWDLATRQLFSHPDVRGRQYRASFLHPDGSQVLEYFMDPPLAHLWKIEANMFRPIEAITNGSDAAAFSPDGKLFATGGDSVRLWDTSSWRDTGIQITNETRCTWLMFSPDGRQLLTGHEANQAWRWNVQTGERLNEMPIFSSTNVLPRFSADGEQLLVNATGKVHVMDWATGFITSSVQAGKLLYEMNFAPDGRQFAVAGFGDQARVWETDTGLPFRLPMTHESGANKVVFSPDGELLATAGFDYQLRIVRAADHHPVFPAIHHSTLIEAVAFSPDSHLLAVGDVEGAVQVWDLQNGAQPVLFGGAAAGRVAHLENGTRIVLQDAAGALRVYNPQTGAEIGPPWKTPSGLSHISVDPSGRFISGALRQKGVRIWDASTHEVVLEIPASAHPAARDVRAIVFKHDGSEFITMMAEGLLQRWSTADGTPVGETMDRGEPNEPTVKVYWSADGRWIAANGVTSITFWDAKTGAMLETIRAGQQEILTDVRLSPDSKKVLLAFATRSIEPSTARIYELPSLRPVGALGHADGVSSTVFSWDGKLVATAGEDNVVRIWRVRDSQLATGPLRHNEVIRYVLFSRDDRVLATACMDGMVRLWDVARGEMIGPPVQLGGPSRLLCFTPDGTRLFANVESAKHTIWSITLAPKGAPLERLQMLVECQAGFRSDASKGAMPLSATELAAQFSKLPADDTTLASAEDVLRWHNESAIIAERRGAWFTAAFHLQWLVQQNPLDADLKKRLQTALERRHPPGG